MGGNSTMTLFPVTYTPMWEVAGSRDGDPICTNYNVILQVR